MLKLKMRHNGEWIELNEIEVSFEQNDGSIAPFEVTWNFTEDGVSKKALNSDGEVVGFSAEKSYQEVFDSLVG
jgi:hypothetical protein